MAAHLHSVLHTSRTCSLCRTAAVKTVDHLPLSVADAVVIIGGFLFLSEVQLLDGPHDTCFLSLKLSDVFLRSPHHFLLLPSVTGVAQ